MWWPISADGQEEEERGALGFPLEAGGQGGASLREAYPGEVPPTPPTYIKAPLHPLAHSSHSPLLPSLALSIWRCVRELEETPPSGHRSDARFHVQVLLLSMLCWTGARGTSIHRTCVELQRCCHL
jgi:hypothetical protein